MVVTIASSLADRDMFMRFRGGGIGHIYMRQIEWWLDATGWGTTWPSLGGKDPSPDPLSEDGSSPGRGSNNEEGDVGDEEEDEDEDGDGDEDENGGEGEGDVDDEDGEDQEQPEESDDDSDAGESGRDGRRHPSQSIIVEQDESEEEESSL